MAAQDKINFSKYSDKKLKNFIDLWEQCPMTRSLNSYAVYAEALTESFKRFSDQSYWKMEYFKEHLEATIEDFEIWFREI
jgi:hypothetical protein